MIYFWLYSYWLLFSEERQQILDQYNIIIAVYKNKTKEYARLEGIVEDIKAAGLRETIFTNLSFDEIAQKWRNLSMTMNPTIKKVNKLQGKVELSEKGISTLCFQIITAE